MNNSSLHSKHESPPNEGGPSPEETLYLRLSSAAEALVTFLILGCVLPSIYRKRNRASFYPRLAVTYVIILLIIFIRFYDFLEANIFQSLQKDNRIRFLLYGLATIEAMFDMSLVALGTEVTLELCSTVLSERKLWVLFLFIAIGIPITFLFLILTIWESRGTYTGVVAVALTESLIPALAILLITALVYWQARRKKLALTEDSMVRIKVMLVTNCLALTSMLADLILYAVEAEVIMDDLIDAIIKLCISVCYLLVQPSNPVSIHILPSLNIDEDGLGTGSNIQSTILREEGQEDRNQARGERRVSRI